MPNSVADAIESKTTPNQEKFLEWLGDELDTATSGNAFRSAREREAFMRGALLTCKTYKLYQETKSSSVVYKRRVAARPTSNRRTQRRAS